MRKISTEKYVVAGIITIGIFLMGMLLGFLIDEKRTEVFSEIYENERIEFESSQFQYTYISSLTNRESCPAIYESYHENVKKLEKTTDRITKYSKDASINKQEFRLLKRQYILEQLKYWFLAKRAQDMCGEDIVRILYFYSDDTECPDCGSQEFILNYLKSKFREKLLVFAIDGQFESEPMVGILKAQYNHTEYPLIVIEDKVLSGLVEKDTLLNEICSLYSDGPEECN